MQLILDDLDELLSNAPGGVEQTGFVVRCFNMLDVWWNLVTVEVALKLWLKWLCIWNVCYGFGQRVPNFQSLTVLGKKWIFISILVCLQFLHWSDFIWSDIGWADETIVSLVTALQLWNTADLESVFFLDLKNVSPSWTWYILYNKCKLLSIVVHCVLQRALVMYRNTNSLWVQNKLIRC